MSFSKKMLKKSLKGLQATTLIGVCALLSTQLLISNDINASTLVTTAYNMNDFSTTMNRQIPAGYIKGSYKLKVSSKSPNAKDLTSDAAAEILAQEIFRLFKLNLSNETLEIGYVPPDDSIGATWWGRVDKRPEYEISLSIDSSTGELLSISKEIISQNPSSANPLNLSDKEVDKQAVTSMAAADNAFKQNKEANCTKAKTTITSLGYLPEAVKSIEYTDASLSVPYYKNKPMPSIVLYHFNVTTASDSVYEFTLTEDLTQVTDVTTPASIERLAAHIKAHPLKY